MKTYATVVLAAGKGTRMRSTLSKLLHPLAGQPLLAHVLKSVESIPTTTAFSSWRASVTTSRPIVVGA
ncbi:NTP transferase domain-containing protein [Dictyobacter vulcani]|uniref:NTP transferase domain-containing protein n=1 Tax=Dictyobacter vulcani TaxID=2607529 RepID=UPI00124FC67D|nr:NTP transferase domain-containing protein [Dictyobacter vulcani]